MIPGVLALVAAFAGAGVAAASASTRPWIAALTAGSIAFETSVLRPRLDEGGDGRAIRSWRRLELVGLVVGVKLLQVAAGSATLVDAEFAVVVVIGVGAWIFANATLTDLDGIRRAIEAVEGSTPLQRIRNRFITVGVLVALCAAVGAVGVDGMLDLRRDAVDDWSWAPLGYLLAGLAGLGATGRMAERHRWARNGVTVDPSVETRWARAVAGIVLSLGLVGVVFSVVDSGLTTLPTDGIAASGPVGQWLIDQAERLRPTPSAGSDADGGQGEDPGDPLAGIDFADPDRPEWLGDVAFLVITAMVFGWVLIRAQRRRERRAPGDGGPSLAEAIRLLVRAVRDLVAEIWAALRRIFRAAVGATSDSDRSGGVAGRDHVDQWNPQDPIRRRIALAYRHSLRSLAERLGQRPAETSRELARRVADPRFDVVAGGFEEARWSDHLLGEADADRVEGAAERLAGPVSGGSGTGGADG